MRDRILPVAPLDRLIRRAGAIRVSQDAGEKLAEVLEEFALELSKQAIDFASHAKRKTVTEHDIILARGILLGK